jgi:amidophosphoribosyltransferase
MKTGFHEECGVFGVWNYPEASRLTYLGLYAMQHRGQESAGIVSLDRSSYSDLHKIHKGLGLVSDCFEERNLSQLTGAAAIGHVRYSTSGGNRLVNAQPLTSELLNGPIALAHNGNIVNATELKNELKKSGSIFQATTDTEILLHLLARNPSNDLILALKDSLSQLVGAYSFVILSHDKLVAVRDPLGFRPLVLGEIKKSDGSASVVVASESCAFDLIGARFVREVEPGEIIEIDDNGLVSHRFSSKLKAKSGRKSAKCVFEHVYFSRPDSVVFGKSVYESRKRFGEVLATESSIDADIVVPVPDSGVPAAIGYSQKSGIPFEFGIIRNHYIGRTFIQPTQTIRDLGVKIKLNPQPHLLNGKRIVVIDDSLVRGTTSQKIISMVRQAGASEVHLRVASPPTTGPCYYGVDTPQKNELIASKNSIDSIRHYIGADSLSYLSEDGMWAALEAGPDSFCAACFNGDYPTILNDEKENSSQKK